MTGFTLVAFGVIGLAVAALALVRPQVALILLVAFDVSNLNGVVANLVGQSPYKAQLALALLVAGVVLVRSRFRIAWSPVLLGVGILFAGFCLTLLTAADPAASQALLMERVRDLVYFVTVYVLVTTTDSVKQVAQTAVLMLAGLAGLTIVHEFVLHNSGDLFGLSQVPIAQEGGAYTARHSGTSADVNFWARLLILISPLAYSLFASATRRWAQIVWAGCAVSLLGGIYLTQSRGGFIAILIAIVCWLALAGGLYRRLLLVLPVVLVILVPLSGVASRLGSVSGGDASVTERSRLQLDAWWMFLDSPLLGHGIGSYGSIFGQYDRLVDNYQPVLIKVAAHNLYLEQAADGGIVLLLAWGLFIGTILVAALRARALSAGDPTTRFLAIGVVAGLVGWLIASVFIHLSDFRALLLIAGISAALDVRARARAAGLPAMQAVPARPRRDPLVALATLAALGVLGVAASAFLAGQGSYQNSATMAVVPTATKADGSAAYQLDVVSRGVIVPTLATVLNRSVTAADVAAAVGRPVPAGLQLEFEPSANGGAVTMTVTARNPEDAADFGSAALTLAKERTTLIEPSYQLKGELTGVTPVPRPGSWLLALSLTCLVVAAAGLVRRSKIRRRRESAPRQSSLAFDR